MEVRPDLQLQAAIKSMVDVIIPSIEKNNPLAQEQSRLIVTALTFIKEHLSLQYVYDYAELERYLSFAEGLQRLAGGEDELTLVVKLGKDVLARSRAEPSELENMVRELRAVTTVSVRELCSNLSDDSRSQLDALIMGHSRDELEWERTWLLSLGLDAAPEEVSPIESMVSGVRDRMASR